MNPPIENLPQRLSAHPTATSPQCSLVKSANQCLAARLRAHAILLALLFGATGAAATEGFTVGGTGAALGTMKLLVSEFRAGHPDIAVTTVPNLGSRGGIKAVLGGAIGLAVASRALDESERKLGAVEIEYARTPFVFAVSTRSKVTGVTTRELADIYAGKMAAWADGSAVRVVLRPASDIDTELVKGISADVRRGVLAAEARPGVRFSLNDQDAANDLEKIPGTIGPSTLTLIVAENRALRALTLDGKQPTLLNAASGVYPYHKRLFLVTAAKPPPAVVRFIAFIRSPAGQKILADNGNWVP